MDARHCKKECKKPDCKKRECKSEKKCKPEKKCKSSSSSECQTSCCVPKVVYQTLLKNGQTQSLGVTFTVTTPNLDGTYTCPSQIGQRITISYTITNTGTAAIKVPVMLYSSITGVSKVTCKKLAAGQSVTVITRHKITSADCASTTGISGVANAYANLDKHCLVLVSQPIAIQINNNNVVAGTCAQSIETALSAFQLQLADASAAAAIQINANFSPSDAITRTALLNSALISTSSQFTNALNVLLAKGCVSCESAALSLQNTAIGYVNLNINSSVDTSVPYPGLPTFNLAYVLANLVGSAAFDPLTPGLPVIPVAGSLSTQFALINSLPC